MDNYVDTFNYIPGFAFRDITISSNKISLNWTTPLNETVSIDKDDFSVTIDGNAEVITMQKFLENMFYLHQRIQ